MRDVISDNSLCEIKRIFTFLVSSGYELRDSDVEVTALRIMVPYVGKKRAFMVCVDMRELVVDCYVTRVLDGHIVRDVVFAQETKGVYSYLVEKCGYRGAIGKKGEVSSSHDRLTLQMEAYAELIKSNADKLLRDDELI